MTLGKKSMDQEYYQAISAISRAVKSFKVPPPTDVEDVASVGKLIDYITGERGLPQDATVTVSIEPPHEKVQQEAFRRLKAGLKAIGGVVPENVDSKVSPDKLVPHRNRHESWSSLAEALQCQLPEFDNPKWAMWLSFFITYPFVCVFMILLLTPVFTFLGIAEEAPWYVKVILGPMIFFGTLFLGAVTASKAESLLFRHPLRVHFDSVKEFTSHIAANAQGIGDSLTKNVSTTIDKYVREIVAEEFRLASAQVSNEFRLIHEANLN